VISGNLLRLDLIVTGTSLRVLSEYVWNKEVVR
jgi:hypothetical protein